MLDKMVIGLGFDSGHIEDENSGEYADDDCPEPTDTSHSDLSFRMVRGLR